MRVGFLSASLSRSAGGIYDATRFLAEELRALPGHEVEVFGLKDLFTEQDAEGWSALQTHAFSTVGPQSLGYAPKLKRALEQADLDLLHSHGLWMYPSLASLSWASSCGKPYVVSPHGMLDSWALKNSGWKKQLVGRMYEDAHLKGAACIHALCGSERDAIRAYGLRNPVCVIPNGIDLPDAQDDAQDDAQYDWQGKLPHRARVLLYLGRIHPKKGLENLLHAWRVLLGNTSVDQPWCLVIAGWDQGGHEAELKALASSLSIDGSVFFIGPRFGAAKRACYARADAFVLPSFSEGLPIVVLEAWAHALPVLMTPHCNLPEGFAADAALEVGTDAHEVSSALAALIGLSQEDRIAMGARGRRLVEERFTWRRISSQMESVYDWILNRGPRPDCVFLD